MTDCGDRDYDTIDSLQPEIPHIELNTPTRADLEGDGYSDPRYHGEVNQERGSSTECGPQTKITDENGYTRPDLCGNAATAPHINTPTHAGLEAEGYSDPRYHGDVNPNKGYLSDHDDSTTPTRADLEGDGYSDPRYHGEVNQERGSSTECGPQTKVTNENGYTRPDLWGSAATVPHINTPTRADLEGDGYSDPRYHGEVDQERSSLDEYTDPQTEITDENVYTLPDSSVSNAATYVNTPTRADLEAEGYSDPRYYGEVDVNKGTLSADSTRPDLCGSNSATQHSKSRYINTPTRSDLEAEGYSDPRYYGDVDVNKGSLSADSTRPDLCGSNSATQHSKSRYINTPTRADLEAEGYSDPRYYGD